MNYQQFLLYSERKIIIYRKLMIQLDTKWLNCQIHQDMKLNAGL